MNAYDDDVLKQLQQIAALENEGRGICSFIVENGRFWTPKAYDPLPRFAAFPKQCFSNCRKLLSRFERSVRNRYFYVEGYAASGALNFPFAVHHAWLVNEEGHVVDPTWNSPETSSYFGVPFKTDYLLKKTRRTANAGSLIDSFQDRFKLIRDPQTQQEAILDWDAHEHKNSGHADLRPN